MNILSVDKKIVRQAETLWNQYDAALSPKSMTMAQATIHNETKVDKLVEALVKGSRLGLTERYFKTRVGHITSPWLRFVALVEFTNLNNF
jgi:hypothetical protein